MSRDIRRQLEILLVEDNDDDAAWTIDALAQEAVRCNLTRVEDGEAALHVLKGQGGESTLPHLVLLDLSLPRKTGLEVLRDIRKSANQELKNLPVVIMTVSTDFGDAKEALNLGVASYMSKPVKLEDLVGAVKRLLPDPKLTEKQRAELESWARDYRDA